MTSEPPAPAQPPPSRPPGASFRAMLDVMAAAAEADRRERERRRRRRAAAAALTATETAEKRAEKRAAAAAASRSSCHPDRPGCQPLIIYLPDELFADRADDDSTSDDDGDYDADDDDDNAEDSSRGGGGGKQQHLATKRNGQVLTLGPVGDPAVELLLRSLVHRFEPDRPDMLDRLIAMFNSGRHLGPEGEAQARRQATQRRRLERRRVRRLLADPDWSPTRRQMTMADCFRSIGRILMSRGGSPAAAAPAAAATSDLDDEGTSGCSPASSSIPSSPEPRHEILDEPDSLDPDAEDEYCRVLLAVSRSPVVYFLPDDAEDPESAVLRRWRRHCARQAVRRQDWETRLAEVVGDALERRLSGALYEPVWCTRLTSLLASDLLELVMRVVGDEFKVVCLLSIGSVTEMRGMAMQTRSMQFDEIDTCKVFHYQNESVCAALTCHLFQRFDRRLEDNEDEDGDEEEEAAPEDLEAVVANGDNSDGDGDSDEDDIGGGGGDDDDDDIDLNLDNDEDGEEFKIDEQLD